MNNNNELDNVTYTYRSADLPPFFNDYESEEETTTTPTNNDYLEMDISPASPQEPNQNNQTLNQILEFFNHEKIQSQQKKQKKTLIAHLLDISINVTTATDLIEQVKKASNGNIFGKFFKLNKTHLIREKIEKYVPQGVLAMVTIKKESWTNEIILCSDEVGVCTFEGLLSWEELGTFLTEDSFVDVGREEVNAFWDGKEDIRAVLAVEQWRSVNVLGQLGSLLLPSNWPTNLKLPCAYESGLTLFTNIADLL